MADTTTPLKPVTAEELERMHALYRKGGEERQMAPHIVYRDPACPHPGCQQRLQAIDFRLEAHGRDVHDPLVRAWWSDVGFAGRCPGCGGWIHFTIRGKRAITAEEAGQLPQLPDNWAAEATIL
jgi:hypothetical protein